MFFFVPTTDIVLADSGSSVSSNVKGEVHRSKFADGEEKLYYRLEAGMPEDEEASWYQIGKKTGNAITIAINETIMAINRVIFWLDRKSTRLNSSHVAISYAVFGLKKKTDSPHRGE